jgi:superoxide reductase
MKGLVCKVCGYVALDGKTDICPLCHTENCFEEKEDAYKTPDFITEKGESEKKHIPAVTVVNKCGLIPGTGCVDVHVKIGEILHPSLPEHHIMRIVFYHDNKYIASASLTENVNPAAVAHLKSGTKGKISIIETCNIHGSWYNEVSL